LLGELKELSLTPHNKTGLESPTEEASEGIEKLATKIF